VDRFNAVAFTTLITMVITARVWWPAAALLFVDNIVTDIAADHRPVRLVVRSDRADAGAGARSGRFAYRAARGGEPLFGQVVRTEFPPCLRRSSRVSYRRSINRNEIGISMNRRDFDTTTVRRSCMYRLFKGILVVLGLALVPSAAFAQARLSAMHVTLGAILPGVTVEASSPALIEKVRTVVTNGVGQYSIQDLRPGTYTVTFTLPGFSTVKRDGIELTGSFIATVNGDLRVGGVQETVTVSGERRWSTPRARAPSRRSTARRCEIPTSRLYSSLTQLVPALNVQGNDVGGHRATSSASSRFTGGRRNEGRSGRRHERRLSGHGRLGLCARGRHRAGSRVLAQRRSWGSDDRRAAVEHHR
jgi:hypothetical protein